MVSPCVAVFRPTVDDLYQLLYRSQLPCNSTGSHTFKLDCPISVMKGDLMAILPRSAENRSGISKCVYPEDIAHSKCKNVEYQARAMAKLDFKDLDVGKTYNISMKANMAYVPLSALLIK